jgi:hypothetical protein
MTVRPTAALFAAPPLCCNLMSHREDSMKAMTILSCYRLDNQQLLAQTEEQATIGYHSVAISATRPLADDTERLLQVPANRYRQ